MWDVVKSDATIKSSLYSLYLLDAENELTSIKLSNNSNPRTHLTELKAHFQLMIQHQSNPIEMESVLSDTCYWTIIMHSLPESYQPGLQMTTLAE